MQVRVGDMVKGVFNGGSWRGFVLEIRDSQFALSGTRVATIWRPELPPRQQIQTWPLDGQYQIEVIQ